MSAYETYFSPVPFWAMIVSAVAVPLILAFNRKPNAREAVTLIAAVIKFVLVLSLLPDALAGRAAEWVLFEIAEGIDFSLRADPFGVFFALIASGLWILTSCYSIGYMRGHAEKKQTRYFASFALSLSATIGIAFSANLLTFIVFYELLTLATYPLVVHSESKKAIAAGRQYLAYALSAGLLMVAGMAWVYMATGTLEFTPGGILEEGMVSASGMKFLFILFLIGVGVKSGIMPLHSWLPNAMVAPTPVSALLHAVAVVKSGAFGIVRVVGFVFGPEVMATYGLNIILGVASGATIILASLIALQQTNLKRRLAYSTVGHLSYIALGASLLTAEGFLGGMMHISTHATMKITLFFCAGAIFVHTHKSDIRELDGIGRAMPWTLGAFTIGSLGLVGLPPVNGFISKWFLVSGGIEAQMWPLVVVLLLSGLLNAAYFFPIVHRAFFREGEKRADGKSVWAGVGEASPWMVVPLTMTGAISVFFCFFPDLPLRFFTIATRVTQDITGGGLPL